MLVTTGLGGVVVRSINASDSGSPPHSAAAEKADAGEPSGLSAPEVESHVRGLLANAAPPNAPSDEIAAQSSPAQPMRQSVTTVPACVRAGTGRTDTPIATDRITYQGHEAYLVVLPNAADPLRVDVFVVDSSCIEDRPEGPGEILLKDVYQRG